MDRILLEQLSESLTDVLSKDTWKVIESQFAKVGLRWRDDLGPGSGKPRYVGKVLADLDETETRRLAKRCVEELDHKETVSIQDALWLLESGGTRDITTITRNAVADVFEGARLAPREALTDFVERVTGYSCNDYMYTDQNKILRRDLFSFMTDSKPSPASHREALEAAGFLRWPDQRFRRFLEALTHPEIRQGQKQLDYVESINQLLRPDGFELEEAGRMSGHPVFSVRRILSGNVRRPKNLVFSADGPKPEIGLSDALDNDLVILKNAEYCLIYDESVGDDGLRWQNLGLWYARIIGESDVEIARKALGERLRKSLQSPPERHLFEQYFKQWSAKLGSSLPALLPQVYLHYDPRTLKELMGIRRFLVQRMDFLMLLPNGARVVLEVDGKQHYSEGSTASPRRYAETVQADRDLRLAGYDVYRFGGAELDRESAGDTVSAFFERLFHRYL